jgi:hypothetical protein
MWLRERGTRMVDKGKYVVYTGIEDGAATFSLYDDGGVVTQLTTSPKDIPSRTEIGDHFWVDHAVKGDTIELRFDSEFTSQKQEEAQTAVRKYRELQKSDRKKLGKDDDS